MLKPLVLEQQDIPTIQSHIQDGSLTYETLTMVFIPNCKIREQQNEYLNNIIAINPAVNEARKRDKNKSSQDHPIYGMPILLKDNINFEGLPTTAELNF
jgi:amidase